jgi:hypothetical protein
MMTLPEQEAQEEHDKGGKGKKQRTPLHPTPKAKLNWSLKNLHTKDSGEKLHDKWFQRSRLTDQYVKRSAFKYLCSDAFLQRINPKFKKIVDECRNIGDVDVIDPDDDIPTKGKQRVLMRADNFVFVQLNPQQTGPHRTAPTSWMQTERVSRQPSVLTARNISLIEDYADGLIQGDAVLYVETKKPAAKAALLPI